MRVELDRGLVEGCETGEEEDVGDVAEEGVAALADQVEGLVWEVRRFGASKEVSWKLERRRGRKRRQEFESGSNSRMRTREPTFDLLRNQVRRVVFQERVC